MTIEIWEDMNVVCTNVVVNAYPNNVTPYVGKKILGMRTIIVLNTK